MDNVPVCVQSIWL
uniref:Uncharacterized protein n=1 Tax=Rhizophora mucronata TaxID=61149 RepID=A0A2P2P5E4_RHIMU